jgi:hypothetical protein
MARPVAAFFSDEYVVEQRLMVQCATRAVETEQRCNLILRKRWHESQRYTESKSKASRS